MACARDSQGVQHDTLLMAHSHGSLTEVLWDVPGCPSYLSPYPPDTIILDLTKSSRVEVSSQFSSNPNFISWLVTSP